MIPGQLARTRILHRIFCPQAYNIEIETPIGLTIASGQGAAAELAEVAEERGDVVRMVRA